MVRQATATAVTKGFMNVHSSQTLWPDGISDFHFLLGKYQQVQLNSDTLNYKLWNKFRTELRKWMVVCPGWHNDDRKAYLENFGSTIFLEIWKTKFSSQLIQSHSLSNQPWSEFHCPYENNFGTILMEVLITQKKLWSFPKPPPHGFSEWPHCPTKLCKQN